MSLAAFVVGAVSTSLVHAITALTFYLLLLPRRAGSLSSPLVVTNVASILGEALTSAFDIVRLFTQWALGSPVRVFVVFVLAMMSLYTARYGEGELMRHLDTGHDNYYVAVDRQLEQLKWLLHSMLSGFTGLWNYPWVAINLFSLDLVDTLGDCQKDVDGTTIVLTTFWGVLRSSASLLYSTVNFLGNVSQAPLDIRNATGHLQVVPANIELLSTCACTQFQPIVSAGARLLVASNTNEL